MPVERFYSEEMARPAHEWNTDLYNDKHSFVYAYGTSLVDLLNAKSNERILDLGCGSGELTWQISEMAGEVIGIDKSPKMIEKAKRNFPTLKFRVADAADFIFEKKFDAIFSNAALHWVVDFEGAADCMYDNLRTGGRVVLEFGGKDNVKKITEALRATLIDHGLRARGEVQPWYFPSAGEYAQVLEKKGFYVQYSQWYDRPTQLEDAKNGIADWLNMFAGPFLSGLSADLKANIVGEVQEKVKPALFKNDSWLADYKRVRVEAYKS